MLCKGSASLSAFMYLVSNIYGTWASRGLVACLWSCDALSLHNSTHSSGSLVLACLGRIKEVCVYREL